MAARYWPLAEGTFKLGSRFGPRGGGFRIRTIPSMGNMARSKLEWLEKYSVAADSGCIEWTGPIDRRGYGWFRLGGRSGKNVRAHRVAYKLAFGEEPKMLRHSCDNRRCVNPSHLVPGTAKDNSTDMVERERQSRGALRPDARLTDDDVRRARELAGSYTVTALAEMFGVGRTTIWKATTGKTWTHV